MAIVSYEPLPGGGWVAHHDDGTVEYLDANYQSLGTETPGVTPPPAFASPTTGLAAPPPKTTWQQPTTAPLRVMRGDLEAAAPPTTYMPPAPAPATDIAPMGQSFDLGGYGGQLSPSSPFGMPGPEMGNPYGGTPDMGGNPYGGTPDMGGNPYGGTPVAPSPAPAPVMPDRYSGGFGEAPTYADGSQNPLQGGAPRVPGGKFNDGSPGYQKQVYVPGGASAGPFNTSAAPQPSNPAYGGNSSGGSGGGGGGSAAYNAIKAKGDAMAAKVRSMGSGGSSSSSSSYSGGNTPAYKRQQRQYTQDARAQQRAYDDGSYLYDQYKMRGFSKKMDPEQALGFQYRPSGVIPKAVKGISPSGGDYDFLSNLPAAQLSMLMYGNKGKAGKAVTGTTPGTIGSTTRGPSTFTNNLAKFYSTLADTGNGLDYETMAKHLTTAKGKSQLGSMFKNQPIGTATANFESMMNAMLESSGMDPRSAASKATYGERLMDEYSSKYAKKPARKAPPINRIVGRELFA